MKRLLSVLLILLLLTGCKTQEVPTITKPEPRPVQEEVEGETLPPEIMAPEGLTMEMEHAVYDPSVERYTYFVRNDTDKPTGMFGEPYWVQRLEDGQWRSLEAAGGIAFTSIGYALQPGEVMALTCWMGAFSEERTPGRYRLVKQIEDELGRENYTLCAEFEIGESIYTADSPYGFSPLEEVTLPYAAPAPSASAVVFAYDGVENIEVVETFIQKSGLGVACQLRTVQDYGEGTVLVTDVIHEKDGGFFWRQRYMGDDLMICGTELDEDASLVDLGYITEKRFSYLITDGADLYLSNGTDWENTVAYQSDKVLLIPEGATAEMLDAVKEQTAARLAGNVIRYQIWSEEDNGDLWSAGTSAEIPTEFFVSWHGKGGSRGSIHDVKELCGEESRITALEWRFTGDLRITCDTADGGAAVLEFHPETEQLENILCGIPRADN